MDLETKPALVIMYEQFVLQYHVSEKSSESKRSGSNTNNNEIDHEQPPTVTQFQALMQAMLEQQRQANES